MKKSLMLGGSGILVSTLVFVGLVLSDPLEQGKVSLAEGLRTFQKVSLQKAKGSFEDGLKEKPNDPKLHYFLAQSIDGLAYAEELEGNKDKAYTLIEEGVKAAKRSLELDDSSSDAHRILATFYGRIIAIKGGMTGAMYGSLNEEEIQRALQLDSGNAQAHLELGISRANTPPQFGGDLEVGIKEMEEAIRINPKLDMAYYHLGRALLKKGEKGRAREVFEKGLQTNPENGFIKRELGKI
jgi:tetratricopeptide (TPR) repeat protein